MPLRDTMQMTITKRRPTDNAARYEPARELAARAASKHGNPADHVVIATFDVGGSANRVAARLYAAAIDMQQRSRRGDVTLAVTPNAPELAVLLEFAAVGETLIDRGGFALAFGPRGAAAAGPRLDAQLRVEAVDADRSRIVVQGRYSADPGYRSVAADGLRFAAETALGHVMEQLTAGFTLASR